MSQEITGPAPRARWSETDAFGRMRASMPYTVFDSKQTLDAQPLFWDDQETSGSGTGSAHSTDTASSVMSVSATTAGTRVRQTFRSFNYQPGKSQLVFMTFVLDKSGGGTGITRRVGQYNAENGLYLEDAEGAIRFVRRTYVTGSAVDNAIEQADWNIDPLDGTGQSGVALDFTKAQILVIDYEWLGVGRVRMGFNVGGVTLFAHQFLNANNLDSVYMSTPNLPLRFELDNDGTGAASSLETICASVQSEGGYVPTGVTRYASTGGTHVDADSENSVYALLGIRLKAAAVQATVDLLNAAMQIHTASERVEWILYWNPTVAGTFTYSDQTNSVVQIATGATANTISAGTPIGGGFIESGGIQAGNAGGARAGVPNALRLGAAIDGTADEIVLACRPIGGSTDVDIEASLTWREEL